MGYELRAVIAPTATADTVARDWAGRASQDSAKTVC
jgi:hypothetical protein